MDENQMVKIIDVMLAATNTFTRANELLARARAGQPVTDADIDALIADSDAKRSAFDEAAGNG
ncbi:MAG: hypothetical protein OES26_09810 [Gammaproteobacteria bacterium]|nr:hypothetical protein [Gammaproteobacteria bacterium]